MFNYIIMGLQINIYFMFFVELRKIIEGILFIYLYDFKQMKIINLVSRWFKFEIGWKIRFENIIFKVFYMVINVGFIF